MKKEIPILYSTFMAQAKLDWRKSQTRRMSGLELVNACPGDWEYIRYWNGHAKFCEKHNHPNELHIRCPYGRPGDLLWGRESSAILISSGPSNKITRVYKADNIEYPNNYIFKWRPSIHMPKGSARIWDEVTGIRVERIADIDKDDAIAEGIMKFHHGDGRYGYHWKGDMDGDNFVSPVYAFADLWKFINGKPKPIQSRQNGKLITTGYEVYPFNERAAAEFKGLETWKGKPLTVITNPWVWVIESKQLSVIGKL